MPRTIPWPDTILMSYYYAKKFDLNEYDQFRIVGDSGAYSARTQGVTITNDELGEWANKWRHRLFWVACMDVAGNQNLTRKNWTYLNTHYNLQSIPSIHMGDAPKMMDYYVERGCDFLGLGGLAGGGEQRNAQMRWLISVFKYARTNHPHVRFHGWGLTKEETKKLPFWSVDSSSWGSGYRYGTVTLRHPSNNTRIAYRTDGRCVYHPRAMELLTKYYDTKPSDVAYSTPESRKDIVKVSALSMSVYEQNMRRLHRPGISAPTWGLMNTQGMRVEGPHVALADSTPNIFRMLNDLKKGQ